MKRRSDGAACHSAAGDLWRFLLRPWSAFILSVLVWAAPQVAFPADRPNIVLTEPLTDTDTGNSPHVQLYDLASDLGETNNLAEANPEKLRELEGLLKAAQVKRVVFHDGFETPSPQSPPVGWAMWGAEPFKLPTPISTVTSVNGPSRRTGRLLTIDQPRSTHLWPVRARPCSRP